MCFANNAPLLPEVDDATLAMAEQWWQQMDDQLGMVDDLAGGVQAQQLQAQQLEGPSGSSAGSAAPAASPMEVAGKFAGNEDSGRRLRSSGLRNGIANFCVHGIMKITSPLGALVLAAQRSPATLPTFLTTKLSPSPSATC